MSYKIRTIPSFEKNVKQLSKRYRSIKEDLLKVRGQLLDNPKTGIPIGNSCYKIRISIASKNKGKSGGARLITHLISINEETGTIYLLAIYDKSEQENMTENEIEALLAEIDN